MGKKKKNDNELVELVKIHKPTKMDYVTDLDGKRRSKFITKCERLIRSSVEYRNYVQFLKENVDMNKCAFFNNVKSEVGAKIKIEVHHEPFTLYDIVETVLNRHLEEGIPINSMEICDEVMKLHYMNEVGLIPLSKTMHQIVHRSGKIVIPLSMIFGDYGKFIHEYEEYLTDAMITKLQRKIKETKEMTLESFDSLKPTYTYLEVDGFTLPKRLLGEEEAVA